MARTFLGRPCSVTVPASLFQLHDLDAAVLPCAQWCCSSFLLLLGYSLLPVGTRIGLGVFSSTMFL